MKPKFSLKIQKLNGNSPTSNPNTKAEAVVARKRIDKKNDQITKAVEWCIENNAHGHAALKTGMFNLIKDRGTIDRRLDGKMKTGIEKQYCSILTAAEENSSLI